MASESEDSDEDLVPNTGAEKNNKTSTEACKPVRKPTANSDSESEEESPALNTDIAFDPEKTTNANSEEDDPSDDDVCASIGPRKNNVVSATEEEANARRNGHNDLINGEEKGVDDGDDEDGQIQEIPLYVDTDGLKQLDLRTNCSSSKKLVFKIPHDCVVNACFRDAYGTILSPIDVQASAFFGLAGKRPSNTKDLIQSNTLVEIFQRIIWITSVNQDNAVQKMSMLLPCHIVDWDANSMHYKEFYENATPCYQLDSKTILSLVKKAGPTIRLPNDLTEIKGSREYVSITPSEESKKDKRWVVVNPAPAKLEKDRKEPKEPKSGSRKGKAAAAAAVAAAAAPTDLSAEQAACTGISLSDTAVPAPTEATPARPVNNGVYTEFAHINGLVNETSTAAPPAPAPTSTPALTNTTLVPTTANLDSLILLPEVPVLGVSQKRTHAQEWTVTQNDYGDADGWPAGAKWAKITKTVEFHWEQQ